MKPKTKKFFRKKTYKQNLVKKVKFSLKFVYSALLHLGHINSSLILSVVLHTLRFYAYFSFFKTKFFYRIASSLKEKDQQDSFKIL